MQVKQLIERAGRSTTGTLPTRHQTKRTLRKKLIVRERGIEEEKEQRTRAQTEPHKRGDDTLTRDIRSLVHEIEVR